MSDPSDIIGFNFPDGQPVYPAREMTTEDRACDCGCEDIDREPFGDLTYYVEEPVPPAGVSTGYLVIQYGTDLAEVATVAMIHDGEGRWVGDVDKDSWQLATIREGEPE